LDQWACLAVVEKVNDTIEGTLFNIAENI